MKKNRNDQESDFQENDEEFDDDEFGTSGSDVEYPVGSDDLIAYLRGEEEDDDDDEDFGYSKWEEEGNRRAESRWKEKQWNDWDDDEDPYP